METSEIILLIAAIASPCITYYIFHSTKRPDIGFEFEINDPSKSFEIIMHNYGEGYAKVVDHYIELDGKRFYHKDYDELMECFKVLVKNYIAKNNLKSVCVFSIDVFKSEHSRIARTSKESVFLFKNLEPHHIRNLLSTFKIVLKYKSTLPFSLPFITSYQPFLRED